MGRFLGLGFGGPGMGGGVVGGFGGCVGAGLGAGLLAGLLALHPCPGARLGRGAGEAAHAQVEHEARVVGGEAAEFGCRHFVPAQESGGSPHLAAS